MSIQTEKVIDEQDVLVEAIFLFKEDVAAGQHLRPGKAPLAWVEANELIQEAYLDRARKNLFSASLEERGVL